MFYQGVTFIVFLFFNLLPHGLTASHEPVAIMKIVKESFSMFSLSEWEILNDLLAHVAPGRFIISATGAWWHRLLKRWTRFWQCYCFPEVLSTVLESNYGALCSFDHLPVSELLYEVLYIVSDQGILVVSHKHFLPKQCLTRLLEEMGFSFIFHLLWLEVNSDTSREIHTQVGRDGQVSCIVSELKAS